MIPEPYLSAALGTSFTFAMTAVGASFVFLFKNKPSTLWTKLSLGFAAGIMIAASVWSLLIPAIDKAEELGQIPALPAAGGFILGALFLLTLDQLMPHLHPDAAVICHILHIPYDSQGHRVFRVLHIGKHHVDTDIVLLPSVWEFRTFLREPPCLYPCTRQAKAG